MRNEIEFETLLRQRGLKVTPQRLLICKLIHQAGHINIDGLSDEISNISPSISLATIYKNLNSLMSEKIIREIKVEGAKSYFEYNQGAHVHFVCKGCGAIEDLVTDSSKLLEYAQSYTDRAVTDCALTVYGFCSKCSN